MSDLYQFHNKLINPWSRDDFNLVSDFSARRGVLSDLSRLRPKRLIDLGCGEGFISRKTESYWHEYHGYDNSIDQITHARDRSTGNSNFHLMDMNDVDLIRDHMQAVKGSSKNSCFIGIFSISYLKVDVAYKLIEAVWNIQSPGDSGIFTLPHPFVTGGAHVTNELFQWDKVDYFDSDKFVHGRMAGCDGTWVEVGCYHKTFEDVVFIFQSALKSACFEITELKLQSESSPAKFDSLVNVPLHIKVKWRK